jgi:hypothetical protein
MSILLLHPVGEADLHIDSDRNAHSQAERRDYATARLERLAAVSATGPDGDLARLLIDGAWADGSPTTGKPGPLAAALSTLPPGDPIRVLLLGTRQRKPDHLDTERIATMLAAALAAHPEALRRAAQAEIVIADDLAESAVVAALAGRLGPDDTEAVVSWGTGSTILTLGSITAATMAGLPWRLANVLDSAQPTLIDPLSDLDVDPVVALLVRWRMFGELDDLAARLSPPIRLTDEQRALVGRNAQRWRDGYQARDTASLGGLVADAVVRRDGTSGLAVRRYVERRYYDLLEEDRRTTPDAVDLLTYGGTGRTLGRQVADVRDRPELRAQLALPSGAWLADKLVGDLIELGKASSHALGRPAPAAVGRIAEHLRGHLGEEVDWDHVGLRRPAVIPADTVLVVFMAGMQPDKPDRPSVACQLLSAGIDRNLLAHLDGDAPLASTRLRALILGSEDSIGYATQQVAQLVGAPRWRHGDARPEAWAGSLSDYTDPDPSWLESCVEARMDDQVGALLLVPTGAKGVVLRLIQVMRRLAARHGVPLFISDLARRDAGDEVSTHLWPALSGGELPLLVAARSAMLTLELDVAWRLLSATSAAREHRDQVRQLAAAVACREPTRSDAWPLPDPAPTANRTGRTLGMAAQRLHLVSQACQQATSAAELVRYLVLGACAVEVSVRQADPEIRPQHAGARYRDGLAKMAARTAGSDDDANAALVLLTLNDARDLAPVTHGGGDDADEAVRLAVKARLAEHDMPALRSAVPITDVRSLLHAAVAAAERLHGPLPPPEAPSLSCLYMDALARISEAIAYHELKRRQRTAATATAQ